MYRLMLLAMALATLAAPASAQAIKTFKAWTAVCDNLQTCSAFGYTEEGAGPDAFIRLVRAAGPDAAPQVILAEQTGEEAARITPVTWRIAVDGAFPAGLGAVVATGSKTVDGERRVVLTPPQSARLLAALRNGSDINLTGGPAPIAISLAGSSAAMLWIDDRQGRVGTVTALATRGRKPASTVSAAPSPPIVRAAPSITQAGLPAKLPKTILASPKLKDCDDPNAQAFEPTIARLGPGQVLWAVPCSAGAYNLLSVLLISDETGRGAREIKPPDAQAPDPDADDKPMNIAYDPATRTLSSFAKGRGLGDCGSQSSWVWDGESFRLLDEVVMTDCRGVMSGDWPSLYHADHAG
jgi:hypothetical protein